MLTPLDQLLLDEAPNAAAAVLCVECSAELVAAARERYTDVRAYADRLDALGSAAALDAELLAGVDLVLLALPHSLQTLDDLAERIATWAAPGVRLVAAGRVKHMTRTQNDVLAHHFASVSASLGRAKCRALHASGPQRARELRWPKRGFDPTTRLTLAAYGATFNGSRLDAGTRLLLGTEPRWRAGDAVDLGCGNGVLACVLARSGHRVTAVDISRAAVAATTMSLQCNGLSAEVLLADGLTVLPDASADLVVTNPPFHVGVAKDSTPTLRMLADARRVLRPGGELWGVYNSHLPYLGLLRQHFADVRVAARDRAYTVVRAA